MGGCHRHRYEACRGLTEPGGPCGATVSPGKARGPGPGQGQMDARGCLQRRACKRSPGHLAYNIYGSVKAMVLPVVMYGCESWTIKKAERRRIDAFKCAGEDP